MQEQQWQLSYFTRMKELYLQELTFEQSLKKYSRELAEQARNDDDTLLRNVNQILERVSAGQNYIEGLKRASNPDHFLSDISPVILTWNAAGVAAMSMNNVYKYLCPDKD